MTQYYLNLSLLSRGRSGQQAAMKQQQRLGPLSRTKNEHSRQRCCPAFPLADTRTPVQPSLSRKPSSSPQY